MFKWPVLIVSAISLGIGLILLGAAPGAGFGFWDYSKSFELYRLFAQAGLIAAGISLLIAIACFVTSRRALALFALVAALCAGAGGIVPAKMRTTAMANPMIHDITTDFENPPEIIAGAQKPRKNPATYVGAEKMTGSDLTVMQAQQRSFPEIVPVILEDDLDGATAKARATLAAMKMEVIAEGPVGDESDQGWRIEAVHTSTFFRFKDDFIVRLTPSDYRRCESGSSF